MGRVVARAQSTQARAAGKRRSFQNARSVRTLTKAKSERESTPVANAVGILIPGAVIAGASYVVDNNLINTQPIADYFRASSGFIIDAHEAGKVPFAVERFFHGASMFVVLAAMGGYGVYLGFQVRSGNSGASTFGPTEDTAGSLHPKLMALAGLLMFAGANGGVLFRWLITGEMLESEHAKTALGGLVLFLGQGVLGKTMGSSQTARNLHAFLGSTTMAVFGVHAVLGMKQMIELPSLAQ